ncbi:MAG: aquaporin [Acidimicrobiales bacterium]
MTRNARIAAAELIGTAILMIGGPGSAILAGERIGLLGISLAFGLSLLVMAYAIGPISGCHINPAVTLGLALTRKIEPITVPFYVIGQLVGAALGGLAIWVVANDRTGFDATNNFAQNGWGSRIDSPYGITAAILVEIVFTAILVFVVLSTTHRSFSPGAGGLAAGMTLALIHLVTIPVDNTSVNPARSFGAALFAGGDAWAQLWVFVVFPLVGAVVGVLAWLAVDDQRLEDTALGSARAIDLRDALAGVTDKASDRIAAGAERLTDR